MERWWNDADRRKATYAEKLPHFHFVHHQSTVRARRRPALPLPEGDLIFFGHPGNVET